MSSKWAPNGLQVGSKMAKKVPMATKFQWQQCSNSDKVPMVTKVPTVPMATKRSLAVLASYEIWACFLLNLIIWFKLKCHFKIFITNFFSVSSLVVLEISTLVQCGFSLIHWCQYIIATSLFYEVNDPLLQVCYKP